MDIDDMMWAACAYIFWPVLWLPLMLSERRNAPFVRFHAVQAALLGLVSTVMVVLGTGALTLFYSQFIPQSIGVGVVMMLLFCGWLLAVLLILAVFLYLAWQAARGNSPRVPVLAGVAMSFLE